MGKKCVVKQKDGVIDESNKNKVKVVQMEGEAEGKPCQIKEFIQTNKKLVKCKSFHSNRKRECVQTLSKAATITELLVTPL